jgi:hypothetical protein
MKKMCCLLILLILITVSIAPAAVIYNEWRGTSSDWNVASNWNLGYVPKITLGSDNIRAGFKGNAAVTAWPVVSGATIPVAEAYNISLGGASGGALTIETGGVLNVGQYLTMGASANENGTLYMNGGIISTGIISTNAHLFVGQQGRGTVYMNGGVIDLISVNQTGNLRIADVSGSQGKLYLNAGTIYANDLLMPYAAAGSFEFNGGKLELIGNDVATVNGFITAGKIITAIEGYYVQAAYDSGRNRTVVMAVPEPATICLLSLGALLLGRKK